MLHSAVVRTNKPICTAALPLAASCSLQASRLPHHVGCTASTAEKNKEKKRKKKRIEKISVSHRFPQSHDVFVIKIPEARFPGLPVNVGTN